MSHAHRHINLARLPGPGDWWTPPDDLPYVDCEACEGEGEVVTDCDDSGHAYSEPCECCGGSGYVDAETGEPYDLRAIEHAAQDRG